MEIEEWGKMKKKVVCKTGRQAYSQKVVICQKEGPKIYGQPLSLAGATPACKL